MPQQSTFDLVVIGGGINGSGIAADAAGRGLDVLLAEQADLASGTSSASSKLIHGGLRYLEHYEFRLVREALAEREMLLAKAPHIIWPLRFVLPHEPGLRPRWMIRAGLFLYDHLASRKVIPGSASIDLRHDVAGQPLQDRLTNGFTYWDCWVDDARLVVLNARMAVDRGAEILTRSRVTSVEAAGHFWQVRIEAGNTVRTVQARALVNAAGPWAGQAGALVQTAGVARPHVRLVKGSHIVVPRISGANDAYLLQNADGRIVFALPYEQHFTLIGTTDLAFTGDPATVAVDPAEEHYLLDLASHFFKAPLRVEDIVWRYSGVRPLYDDAAANPSAVTRDYHLTLSSGHNLPPLLTVLGGKVTTYRRLAEEALDRLSPYLAKAGPAWTATAPLPGGDLPGADFPAYLAGLQRRYPGFDVAFLRALARRHGTIADVILDGARTEADLGQNLSASLTEREVLHMRDREWARTAEDILWRRTKVGLHLSVKAREKAATAIEQILQS